MTQTLWLLIAKWGTDVSIADLSETNVSVYSDANKALAAMEQCIRENYNTGLGDEEDVRLANEDIEQVRNRFSEESGTDWIDASGDYALEIRPATLNPTV